MAVFIVLFLIISFTIIYMILVGFILPPFPSPAPPPVTGPTGPQTGSCATQFQSDSNNCGATGVVCNTAVLLFCRDCSCQCVTGSSLCTGAGFGGTPACVFLNSSSQNCGTCGNICTGGSLCCNGTCVDVLSPSSTANCGRCGATCTGTQVCCQGFCRDLVTDPTSCGACFNSCGTNGQCCNSHCTGISDPRNCGGCGIVCPANHICQNASCVPGCPTGSLSCSGQCIDPLVSNTNCNGCGIVCNPGTFCSAGGCAPTTCTNPGEIFCPEAGGCINVVANASFCGDCVTQCPNGACVFGQCQCSSTFDCPSSFVCQFTPVTTLTVVPSGAPAGSVTAPGPGFCVPPACTPGTTFCTNTQTCSTTSISAQNCGECGTICRSGTCNGGHCTCPGGDSDCPPGSICVAGTCVLR